jgi:hypothetical protein
LLAKLFYLWYVLHKGVNWQERFLCGGDLVISGLHSLAEAQSENLKFQKNLEFEVISIIAIYPPITTSICNHLFRKNGL